MIIGFSGTRNGMTDRQKLKFVGKLNLLCPTEFRHGDCVGADAEAHDLVREHFPKCKIIIHPPCLEGLRAFKKGDFLLNAKDYLVRNRDIVYASECLVAAPRSTSHQVGGTWSTIRFARKEGKPIYMVGP